MKNTQRQDAKTPRKDKRSDSLSLNTSLHFLLLPRRLGVLAFIFFSFAFGATIRADDALDQKVAQIKKSGEPIEPADFNLLAIPDDQNAAVDLLQAGKAVNTKTPAWVAYDKINDTTATLTDSQAATLRKLAAENAKVFALIDQAMTRKSVDWKVRLTSPVMATLLPYLNDQRTLANLLQADALLHQHDHASADALADVSRLLFVGRAVDQQGFVVGHLVSIGIEAVASSTAELIAPDLTIGPAPAASPEQVKQLITELLNDAPSRKGMSNGLLMERMDNLDFIRCVIDGKVTRPQFQKLLGPKTDFAALTPESAGASGVLLLPYLTDVLRVFESADDLPTFESRCPRVPAAIDADPRKYAVANLMSPSFDRIALTHYRGVTTRHFAAVTLAVRAYAIERDNKPPAQLTDLVPEYFPTVPSDPMAAGAPLQYVADKSIVYSVGDDGIDDGGSEKPTGKGAGRWQTEDNVLHLDRQPRK